jgi:hypothetical protein
MTVMGIYSLLLNPHRLKRAKRQKNASGSSGIIKSKHYHYISLMIFRLLGRVTA